MNSQTNTLIPKKGTDVELKIESLAFGGMGLSRIGDMIVFIKNAIPEQTVLARITKKRASFLEARTIEVLKESSLSVPVKCEHFKDCGGCTFQNLDYGHQLKAKETQIKDVFTRIGGFKKPEIDSILGCEEIFNYRNKMEFTFSNRRWLTNGEPENVSSDFALGLHVPGRYDKILDINKCHIQSKDSNEILTIVRRMSIELGLEPYDIKAHTGFMRHLMIKHAGKSNQIMVNIVTSRNEHQRLQPIVDLLINTFPNIKSIVNNITTRRAGVSTGEEQIILYGNDTIMDQLGDYEYMISADSFFQTNTHQAKRLYDIIKEESQIQKDDVVYDLFCGTGSISIYLAKLAKKVYGFELSMSAVQDAIQNAHLNGIKNSWFFAGDLMNLFQKNIEAQQIDLPDVIIVDPPRAGLHPNTISDIIEKKPRRLVYVSCNPATQARDLKLLCEHTFKLMKMRPVDMFPHTPHVENVATLILSEKNQ